VVWVVWASEGVWVVWVSEGECVVWVVWEGEGGVMVKMDKGEDELVGSIMVGRQCGKLHEMEGEVIVHTHTA